MILILDLEIELLKGEIKLNELELKYKAEQKEIQKKYTNKNILEIKTE